MGRVQVLRGDRKQVMAYLQSHPEIQQLTLIIREDERGTAGCAESSLPEGVCVFNGVPLFPDLPDMVPVTAEIVRQLLDEEKEKASTD